MADGDAVRNHVLEEADVEPDSVVDVVGGIVVEVMRRPAELLMSCVI